MPLQENKAGTRTGCLDHTSVHRTGEGARDDDDGKQTREADTLGEKSLRAGPEERASVPERLTAFVPTHFSF